VNDLFVDSWGSGTPVVLVHGSLATGADEWQAQRPLADEGFRLLVPDRRGYGRSPAARGEDVLSDANDIAALMGDGAHLVGHSDGGLGVLFAAARRPDAALSLTLLEPGAFTLGQHDQTARTLVSDVRRLWDQDLADEEGVVRFLRLVGSDPDTLAPELIAAAVSLVPVVRGGRPIWEVELPLAELATAAFPKLVVSGGHHAGFDAICDDLAGRIGASRVVVEGAGHEIQFAAGPSMSNCSRCGVLPRPDLQVRRLHVYECPPTRPAPLQSAITWPAARASVETIPEWLSREAQGVQPHN
jgi:pimeloyl-ACP methyl ester carboxylesterase